jgi:hypothetical protein
MFDIMSASDEYTEYGQVFNTREIVPYYVGRTIKSMNIIQQDKKHYTWELRLDCGHTLQERTLKSENILARTHPTGWYRDCPICEQNRLKRNK